MSERTAVMCAKTAGLVLSLVAAFGSALASAADDERPLAGALFPAGLRVDTTVSATSNGNGVLEPEETAIVAPSWTNMTASPATGTGTDTGIAGPEGVLHVVTDHTADYGVVLPGATVSCTATGDCYAVRVGAAAPRPAVHWDAVFGESATGTDKNWLLHVGDSFTDVPRGSAFYRFVETLLHNGVTGGCAADRYCPSAAVTRQEMAVFALASKEGRFFAPRQCVDGATAFGDVPATSPFCPWIEELARRSVVGGCGGGAYCPGSAVTRDQMAVFVLLTREGAGYLPPLCVAGAEAFNDVPASSPFCRWIEELARRHVVGGCGGGDYCPSQPVTREQMSVFLSLTFGLSLYGLAPGVQVVTNTGDAAGACTPAGCSLRAAITAADAWANQPGQRDEIRFLIPGSGVHTIRPLSALPQITQAVIVDGYSQPGARPNGRPAPEGLDGVLSVELDGSGLGFAPLFYVTADDTLFRGLVLNRSGLDGISFNHVNGGGVEGCYLGTNASGTAALAPSQFAVVLSSSVNVVIGGTRPAARNLISGNREAVHLGGSNNRVQGNLIGTNAANTAPLGNGFGISIRGSGHLDFSDANVIGGAEPGVFNVIVGSQGAAVGLTGFIGDNLILAHSNRIEANFIGTNGRGVDMPNGTGVSIDGGIAVAATRVGGTGPGFPVGNVIRANTVGVDDGGASTFVQGNLIAANGTGVSVGSGATVSGNTISQNAGVGVSVVFAGPSRIQDNHISGNGALGIDITPAGVNPNDAGDGDTGANGLQNYPVLSAATRVSGGVRVVGTLNSRPSQTFTIDVYLNTAADPSGFGEGERPLGSFGVTTDAAGNAAFDITLPGAAAAGERVSATATDTAGNTSEFSATVALP